MITRLGTLGERAYRRESICLSNTKGYMSVIDMSSLFGSDKDQFIVELSNGNTIRTNSFEDNPNGSSYIQICDRLGQQIGYYKSHEWQDQPEFIMGAIIGLCEASETDMALLDDNPLL